MPIKEQLVTFFISFIISFLFVALVSLLLISLNETAMKNDCFRNDMCKAYLTGGNVNLMR